MIASHDGRDKHSADDLLIERGIQLGQGVRRARRCREDELHGTESLSHQKRGGDALARHVPDREVAFIGASDENVVEIPADVRSGLVVGGKNSSRDPRRNRPREQFALDIAGDGQVSLNALLRAHALECAQLLDGGGREICIGSEPFELLFVEALFVARIEDLEHANHFAVMFKRSAQD